MSEEEKIIQPEKTGLDEKRKSALLRYIAILFAVAFILVFLSLFGQMRNSKTAITELSQSSSSALQKAEQLQQDNQKLTEENAELVQDKKFLQQQVEQLTEELEATEKALDDLQQELTDLQETYETLLGEDTAPEEGE